MLLITIPYYFVSYIIKLSKDNTTYNGDHQYLKTTFYMFFEKLVFDVQIAYILQIAYNCLLMFCSVTQILQCLH